jgi:hypothetical protein
MPDFSVFAKAIRDAAQIIEPAVMQFAKSERKKFVQRIKDQKFKSFNANPLSPKYLQRKIAKGADERIMIATGEYTNRMRVFRKPEKNKVVIRVGFSKNDMARDLGRKKTKVPLNKVARVQELGSAKIHLPSRPHWKPHMADIRMRAREVRKEISVELALRVARKLKLKVLKG